MAWRSASGTSCAALRGDRAGVPARRAKASATVRTAGWVTVTASTSSTRWRAIDFACDAIETGDYLEPYRRARRCRRVGRRRRARRTSPIARSVLFGTDSRAIVRRRRRVVDRPRHGARRRRRARASRSTATRHNGLPLVYVGDAVVIDRRASRPSKVVRDAGGRRDRARRRRRAAPRDAAAQALSCQAIFLLPAPTSRVVEVGDLRRRG